MLDVSFVLLKDSNEVVLHVTKKTIFALINYNRMKKIVLLFSVLFTCISVRAQQLTEIDAIVAQYPKSFNSSEELAALINKDFDKDAEKARAIYSWICTSVKFDTDTYFSKKKTKRIKYKDKVDRAQKLRKQRIKMETKALTEHLAVPEGYATLYHRLCELCGLYGYKLRGTAKVRTFDIGKIPRMQNHFWNVVQVDKKWYFVDAAMGAGIVDYTEKTYQHSFNEHFFFTPPEVFFLTHFPKEQGWLKVEKTEEDFAKLPLYYGEYFKSGFELKEPGTGVLDLRGSDSISFILNSPLAVEKLSYQFNYEKEATELPVEKKQDVYSFSVPFVEKRRGYLTLFYDEKAILSYKINSY